MSYLAKKIDLVLLAIKSSLKSQTVTLAHIVSGFYLCFLNSWGGRNSFAGTMVLYLNRELHT